MPSDWIPFELLLLAAALACSLVVRPWRMLRAHGSVPALATPLLASLALLPWLWAWPGSAAMPWPLQWSGAALATLALGWPLAVPVLCVAGLSTMLTAGASWSEALGAAVWLGVAPATVMLVLGHAVRRLFGAHPMAYLLGRAFAVPLLALFACSLLMGLLGQGGVPDTDPRLLVVVSFLMAMGETSWTFAIASLLVACRPQWLATWSDALYLRRQPT
ncbi:MAG TPA: hypothetical protein VLI46_06915 [Ramlibacter sp.]|nr:hypothetical protein [Ramlibacter sp.]